MGNSVNFVSPNVTMNYSVADISSEKKENEEAENIPGRVTFEVSAGAASTNMWASNGTAKNTNEEALTADIQLNGWDPQTPYMNKLKSVSADRAYSTYIALKKIILRNHPFILMRQIIL